MRRILSGPSLTLTRGDPATDTPPRGHGGAKKRSWMGTSHRAHFRRLFERDPPSLNESKTNQRLEADAGQRLNQRRGNWRRGW